MDDLQLLSEVGRETPLPSADDLTPARDRLLAAITAERAVAGPAMTGPTAAPGTAGTRGRRRRSRPVRRLLVAGMATLGLAAAATGVLVLGPDQVGGEVPAANAAEILDRAAAAALTRPQVAPRPDQFIYTRSRSGGTEREAWLSVDGTHDGLIRSTDPRDPAEYPVPGCRDGRAAAVKGDRVVPKVTVPCKPEPAYRADLPTDADAMLEYLKRNASGGGPTDTNAMAKDVMVLAEGYVSPATRAALFKAAARIPGIKVVPDVRDAAGRPGVGISWSTRDDAGVVLVFDAEDHTLLGTADSAQLEVTIADRAGQRP
ncbi:CU044_5270 family protein [Micromonospora sp. CPCC 205556]|uniref:CU044_5270 family protein n=1 Tax=Micromonospora sp. CPCC 205556 TaxID=3122398 RepID=UPI002FF2F939